MILRLLITAILLSFSICATGAELRIGLISRFKNQPIITVSATAEFRIYDSSGAVLSTIPAAERVTLSVKDSKTILSRTDGSSGILDRLIIIDCASNEGILLLASNDCPIAEYHGKIEVKLNDDKLSCVNIVDLEDYVRGVLPSEMPSTFHLEALKAQAVAARTYAWNSRGRHGKSGFDLCDSTDCQVYHGAAYEKPSTSEAVKQTAGQVLVYNGKLISAQFCSDCGGITKSGGQAYLSSVVDRPAQGDCDYCEHKGHTWSKSWPVAEFEKILAKTYSDLGGLKDISVTDTDETGRVTDLSIKADKGSRTISGTRLRTMLGNTVIKSTIFSVKIEDGNVIFEGKGYGHGVGLCQWGANGMASEPHNHTYDKILKHYYTDVEIVDLSSVN
ncbi:MAG TPA: SpoIID/LytB domain-containing protein [Armatimonadota bacterium]|nr:SpoIID/LytB domain-containing protein [Armatimonadota bacterium]